MKKMKAKTNPFVKFHNLHLGTKIILIVFFLYFMLQAFIHLYPFVWVFNNSLKTTKEFATSTMAITQSWSFVNYLKVFSDFKGNGVVGYWSMFMNSVWQTMTYLLINLGSSMLVAYAISKFKFPGRNLLYGFMIFTQTIPIFGAGAAAFKLQYALGFYNNPWTIWLGWGMGFDYSAFILYGTFMSISNSYAESASLDGANEYQIFGKVILPQVAPVMAALVVQNFIGRWNNYGTSQVYLPAYPNLAYGLFTFEKQAMYTENADGVYFAALLIAAIPGILIYSFSQNLIIKNISVGGLKG